MREQEVTYCYWSDIDFTHGVVKVSHKPDRNWTPKAYKEREIPVPEKLINKLWTLHAARESTCNLVFSTSGCKPKGDFLDCLKRVVVRAGLGCGHCGGCKHGWCEDWYLHKFRATFATWHLREGVDLRTVQDWCGHSDLESTMRYLKLAKDKKVRAKVNETFAQRGAPA
jgi:integrase